MNRTISRLILVLISTVLTLSVVEIGLRVGGYGEWVPVIDVDAHVSRALSDGWMREDRALLWRIDRCDSNLQSIRYVHRDNPNAPVQAGKNKKRILCLGDSCTFFSAGEVPPYSLELEHRFDFSEEVEVLNAGVPGYSSTQGLAWLESELLAYAPRLFIIYFGWNDHWRAHTVPDSLYAENLQRSPLRLLRLLKVVFSKQDAGANRAESSSPLRVSPDEYCENLKAMHRRIEASGGKALFLTAPAYESAKNRERLVANKHLLDGDDYMKLHAQYNAVVRELEKEGLRIFDLAALFEQHQDPASLFMEDGIHLSGEGISFTADHLHETIVSQGLVD